MAIVGASVQGPPDASFVPLSVDPADWQLDAQPGSNPQMIHRGGVLETANGYGLYFYTKEQFAKLRPVARVA